MSITRLIRRAREDLAATATGLAVTAADLLSTGQVAGTATCLDDPADLTGVFAAAPDRLHGADYQRAINLPDGRRLWTFQDAYVARPGRSDALVHNVAVAQHGACFELLHGGTTDHPASSLFSAPGESARVDPRRRFTEHPRACVVDEVGREARNEV